LSELQRTMSRRSAVKKLIQRLNACCSRVVGGSFVNAMETLYYPGLRQEIIEELEETHPHPPRYPMAKRRRTVSTRSAVPRQLREEASGPRDENVGLLRDDDSVFSCCSEDWNFGRVRVTGRCSLDLEQLDYGNGRRHRVRTSSFLTINVRAQSQAHITSPAELPVTPITPKSLPNIDEDNILHNVYQDDCEDSHFRYHSEELGIGRDGELDDFLSAASPRWSVCSDCPNTVAVGKDRGRKARSRRENSKLGTTPPMDIRMSSFTPRRSRSLNGYSSLRRRSIVESGLLHL